MTIVTMTIAIQTLAATIAIVTMTIAPLDLKAVTVTVTQNAQKDPTGIATDQTVTGIATEIGIGIGIVQIAIALIVIEKVPDRNEKAPDPIEKDPDPKNPTAAVAVGAVEMVVHVVDDLVAVAETADVPIAAAVVAAAQVAVVVVAQAAVAETATIAGATIIGIAIANLWKSMMLNWSKASACWSFIQTDTASFAVPRKITPVTAAIHSYPAR